MKKFRNQFIGLTILAIMTIVCAVFWKLPDAMKAFATNNQFSVGSTVANSPPAFTSGPSDGGSSTSSPTNVGSNVTFSATATDSNSDPYYLAICKTQYVKAGASAAPQCCPDDTLIGCDAAYAWVISSETASGSPVSGLNYQVQSGDPENSAWYAFACDKNASGACSAYSQGLGDTGSPFYVNHPPSLGTVKIGQTCGNTTSIPPGNSKTMELTNGVLSGDDIAYASAIQSDGKILLAGSSSNGSNLDFALVRLNIDGTLDTTFNSTGKVTTPFGSGDDVARALVIQNDGKIVAAGYSYNGSDYDFALARYNTNGSLDTTFNITGKVTTPVLSNNDYGYAVDVQSDGKIVVAGYSHNGSNLDFALVRYNSDGSLDTTGFGTGGKVTTGIGPVNDYGYSIAIQSDGKILVAGSVINNSFYDYGVVRYNTNGSLDSSFGTGGKAIVTVGSNNDDAYTVKIQNDGKIIVGGNTYNGSNMDFALARLNTDGSPDSSFGTNGIVKTPVGSGNDYGYSTIIQNDGKIIVAGSVMNGSFYDYGVVRYNTNGSLDSYFGTGGKAIVTVGSNNDDAYSVKIQNDGKITIVGDSNNGSNWDFALVRLKTDGSLENLSGYGCVQAEVTDSDSDNVDIHVCSTNSFTGTACSATTLCKITGVQSGYSGQCIMDGEVPIPEAHGSYNVYVFTVDGHGLQGTGMSTQSYTVTDVPPNVQSYTFTHTPAPAAGGSDTVNFTATIVDDNGDNDVTGVSGTFYDDAAIDLTSGSCTASEQSCYTSPSCTLINNTDGDNSLTAACSMTVWYNADYSNQWKAHVNPSDQDGNRTVTDSSDSNTVTNPALLGIDVVQSGISYGSIAIGGISAIRETSMGNVGNQLIDIYVSGSDMISGSHTIPVAWQKFYNQNQDFTWDNQATGPGPYPLVTQPGVNCPVVNSVTQCGYAQGCLNKDIQVRANHSLFCENHTTQCTIQTQSTDCNGIGSGLCDYNATNKSIYWKLRIPQNQSSGTYTGQNIFAATSADTCYGTAY